MSDIVHLKLNEPVRLDHDQLEQLLLQLGTAGADRMVSQAMEDLAVVLARVEKWHRAGQIDDVRGGVRSLIAIARQIGMTSLAQVGRDVLSLIDGCDGTAYCAALARLIRIGEGSLVAVWDLQDLSV